VGVLSGTGTECIIYGRDVMSLDVRHVRGSRGLWGALGFELLTSLFKMVLQ
jgi:hypothetical protein